jgi:hypothetical protein
MARCPLGDLDTHELRVQTRKRQVIVSGGNEGRLMTQIRTLYEKKHVKILSAAERDGGDDVDTYALRARKRKCEEIVSGGNDTRVMEKTCTSCQGKCASVNKWVWR